MQAALGVIYFLLSVAMYYFNMERIQLGVDLMYKVLLAAAVAGISFMVFLVRTNLGRARLLLKYICLLILPHLAVILVSMPIWVYRMQGGVVMRRGLMYQIYGIIAVLAMAGILYVFGEKGFWLNLAAMVTANLITILEVIRAQGVGAYLAELRKLIMTFAGETGELMGAVEIHELTFAIGLCLLFCMMNWKRIRKSPGVRLLLAAAVFCFLSGFKRIGIAAIAAAMLSRIILGAVSGGRRRRWLMLFSFCAIGGMFVYIWLVKSGIYEFLSDYFHLDTMGRRELSWYIDEYYWIGPDYIGNGAGFVSRMFYDLPAEYTIRALHNEILTIYIDIGFWGFWLWMLLYMPVRSWAMAKWQDVEGGILCCCAGLFVLLTAMTDNTINYTYVTGSLAISVMSYRLEALEGD